MIKDIYNIEEGLYQKGYKYIAGSDEAGRGPMAGPLVAAAVILPVGYRLDGLDDSKKLSSKKREELFAIINRDAIDVQYEVISPEDVDRLNPLEASRLAMERSLSRMKKLDYVLTDCMDLDIKVPYLSLIKGDAKSLSIAAASVIAKVTRDRMMYELDKKYPMYNYKKNKGYPTKEHVDAINKYGIIPGYRKTYGPVRDYLNK